MIVNEMGSRNNQIDRIYPMSTFSTEAGKILSSHHGLTNSDLHLILTYLARDKSRIIYDAEVSQSHSKNVQSKLAVRPSSSR